MDKNLKFYDLFQHADFINERHGMDSIAVDSIPIPGAEVDPEWKNYIIPTWVADQSFKTCPAIQDAVIARAKHPAFGYFRPRDEYFEGIIRWQKNQYDSDVTKEDIVYANGLLGGVISALNVFCEKGANVLLHAPTYIGFTGCITNNGYHIVHSWLKKDENGVWRMDYEDMEKKIVENSIHATVFCTPHNPCGRVWTKEELEKAYAIFEKYDVKVVIEKAVNNLVEVNCSVLGNYTHQETSVIEEVTSDDDFLTYKDKYIGSGKGKLKGPNKGIVNTSRIIPARISKDLENNIKNTSKVAFKALNLSGICRIDYLIDKKTNKYYINEPNTIPGSLAFYLWEPAGKSYEELLDEAITLAIKDYKNRSRKIYSFESNILSNYGIKGAKGKLK